MLTTVLKGVILDFDQNRPILQKLQIFTRWSKIQSDFLLEQSTRRKGHELLIISIERLQRPLSAHQRC